MTIDGGGVSLVSGGRTLEKFGFERVLRWTPAAQRSNAGPANAVDLQVRKQN